MVNKIRFCKDCNSNISVLHPNKQYCNNVCKRNFILKNKIIESFIKYKNSNEYIECKICNLRASDLASHIKHIHKLSCHEYKIKFNVNNVLSKFLRKQISNRVRGKNNPGYQHNGKFSALSSNFKGYRGLTKKEIQIQQTKVIKKISYSNKNNGNNKRTLAYWMKQTNGDKILSKEKLSNSQCTFSKDICIQKYGKKKGLKIFKNRQNKWQTTLNNKTDEEKEVINRKKAPNLNYRTMYKSSIPCSMYLIKVFNKNETFLKIGLTSKTIKKRFSDKTFKETQYEYEVIYIIENKASILAMLENKIIKDIQTKKYTPNHKFAGWTECFTYDAIPNIQNLMVSI